MLELKIKRGYLIIDSLFILKDFYPKIISL